MKTANAVIIGNEILSGKFADENGPFLIGRLRSLGTRLTRISVVPDDLDDIASEVRRSSDRADFVFTTGGVGPTHDDITFEGIARAFGEPLVAKDELVALLRHYNLPLNDATMRMARVPESTELIESRGLAYPVAKVHNVFVFPGVPKLFQSKFEAISHRFKGEPIYSARLYTGESETRIAERLGEIADRSPRVEIGSYPRFGESDFKVIITLESLDKERLDRVRATIEETFPILAVEMDQPVPVDAG